MFAILDTFRISEKTNPLIHFHIERTVEALHFLKSNISYDDIEKKYHDFIKNYSGPDQKCRLQIINEEFLFQVEPIDPLPPVLKITFAQNHNQITGIGLQNFKTNQRQYWDLNQNSNFDDIIGVNTEGLVTETSRFNLFVKKEDQLFTPTLNTGCINGCLRRFLKSKNEIQEKNFSIEEILDYEILVGNSLRGLQKAQLIA